MADKVVETSATEKTEQVELTFDGRYSWFVLVVKTLNSWVCQGYLFATIGILTSEYPALTGQPQSKVTIVGSLLVCIFLFSVPICSICIKYFGCRAMAGVASLLSITGYVFSAFSTQLWHLIVGYSIIGGFGMSMNFTTTIAIVPHYFKKRMNMAYMTTALGSGMAFATYPFIYSSIREHNSYRKTLLLMLPFMLCSITAPLVFKPRIAEKRPESMRELGRSYWRSMNQFITPFYSFNCFFWNSAHAGVIVLLFTYVDTFHPTKSATTAQTIMGVMEMVGGAILTLVLLKIDLNHYILLIACNILTALFCVGLAVTTNITSIYISAAAIGFIHSVTVGNIACACAHLYEQSQAENIFGIQELLGGLGGLLGPMIAGLLQERHGMASGFYFLAASILFGALLLVGPAMIRSYLWTPFNRRQSVENQDPITPMSESTK